MNAFRAGDSRTDTKPFVGALVQFQTIGGPEDKESERELIRGVIEDIWKPEGGYTERVSGFATVVPHNRQPALNGQDAHVIALEDLEPSDYTWVCGMCHELGSPCSLHYPNYGQRK